MTQEDIQQSTNNISQSPITQPTTLQPELANDSNSNQLTQEGNMKKKYVNTKQKQDDQLVPDQTQDTITEDPNDIIMEDQTPLHYPTKAPRQDFHHPTEEK